MGLQVRTIDASELAEWIACMDVGFLRSRSDREEFARFYLGEIDLDRTWGAIDSDIDQIVGTLRSFATPLTVPGGGQVSAAALTNVTVSPTHRRRGLLTQMIAGDLTASAERNEAVGILIASEYPIYGRYGYGAAADSVGYVLDTRTARFRRDPVGSVELVDLATLRKEAPPVYEAFRALQPGSIARSDGWWDRRLHQVVVPGEDPPSGYSALYRSPAGAVEGFVRYDAEPRWEDMRPRGTLNVEELISVSVEAYSRLWQFLSDVDLVATVKAADRSTEELLPWLLTDARDVSQSKRYDFLWVRILDVCTTLSSRRYQLQGQIVLEVIDSLGFATGRYALAIGPGGIAECHRTTESVDLSLPVDVLGSVYMGGTPLRLACAAGLVDEVRPGSLERADLMFRSTVTPWCATWF